MCFLLLQQGFHVPPLKKGLGWNTKKVIGIFSHRDARQGPMLRKAYTTMYADELLCCLDSELRGNLKSGLGGAWKVDNVEKRSTVEIFGLGTAGLVPIYFI